ncbi:hypothetical protein CRE_27832 [Caenorhabditis remanei]|uniref:BZIP domain-containing protein n=1 Tax=Caenorhabditis remanei TaxID=31234 RepID=E3NA76_CAERE|nr:hypothetical protein CRE_27832 [Caenorhabditis remanei]
MVTSRVAELINDQSFLFAVWLRNSLLFVAFYFAPFPVIERCFATIYMQDYETNKRRWISYLLSTILYIIAFTSAQFFIFGSYREIHIFLITGFNLVAFGVTNIDFNKFCNCFFQLTFVMERYNKKRYSKLRKNVNSDYSLSVRAQLSENINSTLVCLQSSWLQYHNTVTFFFQNYPASALPFFQHFAPYTNPNATASSFSPSGSSTSSTSSQQHQHPTKKKPVPVPAEQKDETYFERRRRNNEAARKSREARRKQDNDNGTRVIQLEQVRVAGVSLTLSQKI